MTHNICERFAQQGLVYSEKWLTLILRLFGSKSFELVGRGRGPSAVHLRGETERNICARSVQTWHAPASRH